MRNLSRRYRHHAPDLLFTHWRCGQAPRQSSASRIVLRYGPTKYHAHNLQILVKARAIPDAAIGTIRYLMILTAAISPLFTSLCWKSCIRSSNTLPPLRCGKGMSDISLSRNMHNGSHSEPSLYSNRRSLETSFRIFSECSWHIILAFLCHFV